MFEMSVYVQGVVRVYAFLEMILAKRVRDVM